MVKNDIILYYYSIWHIIFVILHDPLPLCEFIDFYHQTMSLLWHCREEVSSYAAFLHGGYSVPSGRLWNPRIQKDVMTRRKATRTTKTKNKAC